MLSYQLNGFGTFFIYLIKYADIYLEQKRNVGGKSSARTPPYPEALSPTAETASRGGAPTRGAVPAVGTFTRTANAN